MAKLIFFISGIIVGSMSKKSNRYGHQSVTPPKPKLPPEPPKTPELIYKEASIWVMDLILAN